MKCQVLFLPVLLFIISGCSGAAGSADGRPDSITVQTSHAPDDAYREAAQALLAVGYALSHSDETLRTLTTEYRDSDEKYGLLKGSFDFRVSLTVSSTEPARVTYRGRAIFSGLGEMEVVRRGANSSPAMAAWRELEAAARSYPGGTVVEPVPAQQ